MSHLPRDGRNEGPEPLWAVEEPETTSWEEPTPMPQARAWFSVTERRLGLPARIASRAAGLVAVGALMTTGVAIAAFADDGSSSDKPPCSASVTTDCVKADDGAKSDDAPKSDDAAKSDDAPKSDDSAKSDDAPKSDDSAKSDDAPKSDDSAKSDDAPKSDDSAKSDDAPKSDDSAKSDDTPKSDDSSKDAGANDGAGTSSGSSNDGGSTAGSDDTAGGSSNSGSGSAGGANDGSGSPASGGSDDPATHDAGDDNAAGGAPTPTAPVTNPLPPSPAASAPATTTPAPATDDVSALAGLEVTADTTYFQLPSSKQKSTSSAGGKSVAGGLTDSAGANDIHAVGISALALLQLQRASSLAPPPAPLPNIKELSDAQLTKLRQVARRTGVAWTVLAAANRLGHKGRSLTATARFLRAHGARGGADSPFKAEKALAALYGSKEKGERAAALAAYYWAVGGSGLTKGLADASASLGDALLKSPAVSIYDGGRSDLQLHRVDPRVEMSIRYLQASFGTVSVSCLISGHSVFTTSGNVSAHIFGRAADVSGVGGTAIFGHQGPQTVTERAVRLLLMLPKDVAPRQIISLMDLDGATGNTGSFALPDHADHIHIGY
jgi:hypothetical protein